MKVLLKANKLLCTTKIFITFPSLCLTLFNNMLDPIKNLVHTYCKEWKLAFFFSLVVDQISSRRQTSEEVSAAFFRVVNFGQNPSLNIVLIDDFGNWARSRTIFPS